MIKKTVEYYDIINGEEVEQEAVVRFCFTLAATKLYQQKTSRPFFIDYEKASKVFSEKLQTVKLDNINNLSVNEQLAILPLLADPVINGFLLDSAACFYAEIIDGRYVQNEETIFNAENSLWFMSIANLEFFMLLLQEIAMYQPKDHLKSKKN